MTSDLYREQILDHYGNPRNEGSLDNPDIAHERANPVCGDVIRLEITFEDGRVSEAAFSGQGCVVSMASASMFTEEIHGKTIAELKAMEDEDIFEMLGVDLGPSRANCGVLPLRTLQEGMSQWEEETTQTEA
jgi:nitrogen fixation NifU-like protein